MIDTHFHLMQAEGPSDGNTRDDYLHTMERFGIIKGIGFQRLRDLLSEENDWKAVSVANAERFWKGFSS